ncbi:MAG: IS5 family transposase, partial [Alphaproteobacteria bacterium]
PIRIERMLRIYFLQQWFNMSDPQAEDSLYDSAAMRNFVGIDLGNEAVPDETTSCKFRHLIENNGLSKMMLTAVNDHLKSKGIKIGTGTIMDATLISAPSSTKNAKGERDPEMHQTRKGNQWYFGMKGHIGVDSKEKVIHSTEVTAANVHDSQMVSSLLHGAETKVWGDTAYQGQKEAIRAAAPAAQDMTQRRGSRGHPLSAEERAKNATKSRVRAKGKHPLLIIKRIFGFTHVRYRGLMKNGTRFEVLCALANLYMKRRVLMRYCHA